MKRIATTITNSGQITLPAEVRRILGVKPRDRVEFAIDGNEVRIERMKYTVRTAAGSVRATRTEDIDKMIHEAQEEMAERIVASMRGK